jgi:hypothetical protein
LRRLLAGIGTESYDERRVARPYVTISVGADQRFAARQLCLNVRESFREAGPLSAGFVMASAPDEKWHLVVLGDRLESTGMDIPPTSSLVAEPIDPKREGNPDQRKNGADVPQRLTQRMPADHSEHVVSRPIRRR